MNECRQGTCRQNVPLCPAVLRPLRGIYKGKWEKLSDLKSTAHVCLLFTVCPREQDLKLTHWPQAHLLNLVHTWSSPNMPSPHAPQILCTFSSSTYLDGSFPTSWEMSCVTKLPSMAGLSQEQCPLELTPLGKLPTYGLFLLPQK